jgi:hypothetical protein
MTCDLAALLRRVWRRRNQAEKKHSGLSPDDGLRLISIYLSLLPIIWRRFSFTFRAIAPTIALFCSCCGPKSAALGDEAVDPSFSFVITTHDPPS